MSVHNGNLNVHGDLKVQSLVGSEARVLGVDEYGNIQSSGITVAAISGGLVENIDYYIASGSNTDVIVRQYCWHPFTLESVAIKTVSGTITADVRKNGTSVGGVDSISVSPTISLANATSNNTFAIGDYLDINFTGNSAATDISISIKTVKS